MAKSLGDSTISDSIISPKQASAIDTVITYSADNVSFTFSPRVTYLEGKAKVLYQSIVLEAEIIEVRWEEDILIAKGVQVTIPKDSIGSVRDSVFMKGKPKLNDGTQVIVGEEMAYNIKTRFGTVREGTTDFEDGKYHGTTIKKVRENVYNIRSGFYTTCNLSHPHYGFWSRDMKLTVKDKVIARPLVLYFGPVPVMIVPFGVFPTKGGRQSGLIVPTYGESAAQGRYFTNLGYYYAPNDYYDARISMDFYERFGVRFRGDTRYAKRYYLTGGLSGTYVNETRNNTQTKRWDLRLNHNQTIDPTTTLIANGYFVSDGSYLRDHSLNPNERLRQQVSSDATLNKRWAESPYSGSVNINYREDLFTKAASYSLPRVSFSRNTEPLIKPEPGTSLEDTPWLSRIMWNYRGSTENKTNIHYIKTNQRFEEVNDSMVLVSDEERISRARSGVRHDLNFTTSMNVSHFALTPNFSYSEHWFDEHLRYNFDEIGRRDTTKVHGFRARRTFSTSIGTNTKLYGLFTPNLFGIEAIRHTLSPSLSLNWQPEFKDEKWGYYDVYTDSTGKKFYYDQFAGNIYGATPRDEQMSLNITLANLFEYKTTRDDKEVKGEIFNFTSRTSRNFAADSLKWSDLSSTFSLKPFGATQSVGGGVIERFSGFSFDLSTRQSFYRLETNELNNRKQIVNKPADNFLRLTDFEVRTSFGISGGTGAKPLERDTTLANALEPNLEEDNLLGPISVDRFDNPLWQPSPAPWDAHLSLHYGENHSNPDNVIKNIWSSMRMELQATKNWRVSYDARWDLNRKRITGSTISLYRDLHCWEGRLTWNPIGYGQGFFLIINVKSMQLKDVKVEKRNR